eukprot:2608236-Prymnesium_polylepis.1
MLHARLSSSPACPVCPAPLFAAAGRAARRTQRARAADTAAAAGRDARGARRLRLLAWCRSRDVTAERAGLLSNGGAPAQRSNKALSARRTRRPECRWARLGEGPHRSPVGASTCCWRQVGGCLPALASMLE